MNYTWHEEKAEEVRQKHAIEFAKITDIFSDPYDVQFTDETHSSDDETRCAIIDATVYGLAYLVFIETGEDEPHFITARLAENWMVKDYEENRKRY